MEHTLNYLNNFIYGWYINPKVCKDLIKYFDKSKDKIEGKIFTVDSKNFVYAMSFLCFAFTNNYSSDTYFFSISFDYSM